MGFQGNGWSEEDFYLERQTEGGAAGRSLWCVKPQVRKVSAWEKGGSDNRWEKGVTEKLTKYVNMLRIMRANFSLLEKCVTNRERERWK